MISNTLYQAWITLQVLIGYNLVFPLIVYLLFLLRKSISTPLISKNVAEADYAIILTAYEQTDALAAVVSSILKLNYNNYLIYIVADKCDSYSPQFNSDRVIVLKPAKTLASNTRSHFHAIHNFKRSHERLTIIDSDNLVHPDYLTELNKAFDAGYEAVQGVRAAKNLDTTFAGLDAARDIYYHFYDGKLLFGAGSSATLSGSGMAFTTRLYRACLEHQDVQGAGFDKVLQYAILGKDIRIAFAENAIVYDEKTTQPDQLVKQRSRWINTWFRYFRFGFLLLWKGIKNLSVNQILFGIILVRPPLFILLLLSSFFLFINLWISSFAVILWAGSLLLFVIGFATALASSHTSPKIYQSLVNIPRFMLLQVLSLLKSRKANQHSVATKHYHTAAKEPIKI